VHILNGSELPFFISSGMYKHHDSPLERHKPRLKNDKVGTMKRRQKPLNQPFAVCRVLSLAGKKTSSQIH
jgi:hypothetical protein